MDYEKRCRACLIFDEKMLPIYCKSEVSEFVLSEILNTWPELKLKEDDVFPKVLCTECANMAFQFVKLVKMMIRSEEYLSSLLNFKNDIHKEIVQRNNNVFDDYKANQKRNNTNDVYSSENGILKIKEIVKKNELLEIKTDPTNVKTKGVVIDKHSSSVKSGPGKRVDSLNKNLTGDSHLYDSISNEKTVDSDETSKNVESNEDVTLNQKEEPIKLMCTLCNHVVKNLQILRRHYDRKHPDEQHLKYLKTLVEDLDQHSCSHCNQGFTAKKDLQAHLKKHKRFKCNFCGTGFTRKYDLNGHISTVHNLEAKHHCHVCNKDFKGRSSFARHRKKHMEGEKHIICDICIKPMSSRYALNIHVKTVHLKQRDYKCKLCGDTFLILQTLKRHYSTVHETFAKVS